MSNNLRISSIELKDVNCFDGIEIDFAPDYNVICGTNGIGKTTILNAIGASFANSFGAWTVRRRASVYNPGKISIIVESEGKYYSNERELASAEPETKDYLTSSLSKLAMYLIYVTPRRDFEYKPLKSISRDDQPSLGELQKAAERGITHEETKNWIVNRILFQHLPEKRPPEHIENLELAKQCFSLIDPTIRFLEVRSSTFDIIVESPHGNFPYEYLSSGYRSALSLLLGIIRELEFRTLGSSARSFSGVIVIDEVDLHLHPTWQQAMPSALRAAFPSAQIIVTTHSPHIIQDALTSEVIALRTDDNGLTRHSNVNPGKFGYKGWTVEEILEDVMGLRDPQTPLYRSLIKQFDAALDSDNAGEVIRIRSELEEMLHPSNPVRKLIRLQSSAYEENAR